jgi:hypothetical protein
METKIKLLRLSGEQAARYWPVLSPGYARSMPPGVMTNSVVLSNMLQAVLSRQMDCWAVKAQRGESEPLVASFLTAVRTDPVSGQRALALYSLFSKGDIADDEWGEALALLRKVAKTFRCHVILAFSNNPRILELTKTLGGNCDTRVIELEV